MTILVVDDEPMLRDLLKEELEYEGFEVDAADGGEQALSFLQTKTYDVVLSDIRMPKVSGVDLLKQIRSRHPVSPKVILISGFSDVNEEAALSLGASALLTKPYNFENLLKAVRS